MTVTRLRSKLLSGSSSRTARSMVPSFPFLWRASPSKNKHKIFRMRQLWFRSNGLHARERKQRGRVRRGSGECHVAPSTRSKRMALRPGSLASELRTTGGGKVSGTKALQACARGFANCCILPRQLHYTNYIGSCTGHVSPRMSANQILVHQADRGHFERQILFARPIFVLLALVAALEQPASRQERRSVSFLIAYLVVGLVITQVESLLRRRSWHLPLACDLLALGYFIFISPSTVPVW